MEPYFLEDEPWRFCWVSACNELATLYGSLNLKMRFLSLGNVVQLYADVQQVNLGVIY